MRSRPVANVTSQQLGITPRPVGTTVTRDLGTRTSDKIQAIQKRDGKMACQRVVLSRTGATGVDLVQIDDDVEETQPLISLPNTTANSHTKISVHAPKSREEKITVILHKAAQPLYSFSGDNGTEDPIIVKKDQRAIRPTRKRKALEAPPNLNAATNVESTSRVRRI
jgi:hypothetical protein